MCFTFCLDRFKYSRIGEAALAAGQPEVSALPNKRQKNFVADHIGHVVQDKQDAHFYDSNTAAPFANAAPKHDVLAGWPRHDKIDEKCGVPHAGGRAAWLGPAGRPTLGRAH